MVYQNNVLPIGESGQHIPVESCPCDPSIITHQGKLYLVHASFDHREIWLGVEQMLGITCQEHMRFVDRFEYIEGVPHKHVPRPALHFEYDHEKIDPR